MWEGRGMSGSSDTFFVSDSLTGRLTESHLADQSEEYRDIEDDRVDEELLECVLSFEDIMVSCSVTSVEVSESLDAVSLLVGLDVDSIAKSVLNKSCIERVDFYDTSREKIAEFDTSKKTYNSVIAKVQQSENYRVSLIFN